MKQRPTKNCQKSRCILLGAFFEKQDHVCGSTKCYAVPHGLQFIKASLTPNPGIPETMVNILENFACKQCGHSSLTEQEANSTNMSSDVSITGNQFEQGIRSVVDSINDHFRAGGQRLVNVSIRYGS